MAAASIVVASAQAQTTPPATPEAKPAETAAPAPPPPIFSIWGFDLTGHVDVGYSYLSGAGKFVRCAGDADSGRSARVSAAIVGAADVTGVIGCCGVALAFAGNGAEAKEGKQANRHLYK